MAKTLTEIDVHQSLDPGRVIAAVESAFRDRFEEFIVPPRTQMRVAAGVCLLMPAYDPLGRSLGMKFVLVQDQPAQPEDRVQATYLLLDPTTAAPVLIVAARYLTDLRTAAASAIATKHLAREDVRTLGIFGTGRQAQAHMRVLPLVRRFERILVCGRDPGRTRDFARQMSAELKSAVEPAGPGECVDAADVICTCTTSATPVFDGNHLRPGTHLNLVGAFQPDMREADTVTIQRARVVVETYDGALMEAGDLLIPIRDASIGRDHILADLHELLSGKKAGRTASSDITLFKSTGCALEDLVTAELLVDAGG